MTEDTSTQPGGILNGQDIEALIDEGKLIANARKENINACSYDMRIGTIFKDGQIINGEHSKADEQVIVQPGEIISLFTLEELEMPKNMAATAFAINRMSSRGFLILNPGHITVCARLHLYPRPQHFVAA